MKKFIRKNLFGIVGALVVFFISCIFFVDLHEYATAWRGYCAVGGEIFVFVLPLIVYVVYRNIKDR